MDSVFAVLTALYALLLLSIERGARLLSSRSAKSANPIMKQSVSVIIAAKNELDNLPRLLLSLAELDYPDDCYELILVNDHSTDGSREYLASQQFCPKLKVIDFYSESSDLIGKKAAIMQGITAARHDILVFTDADCIVPKSWLQEINRVLDSQTDYLISYSVMQREPGSSTFRLKNFERSIYYALAAAGLFWGIPITSSACNMVYRKSLFLKSGGFNGIGHLPSGDDDLLLVKMFPHLRRAAYNPALGMQVISIDGTDRDKHHQTNIRRASKFRHHPWWIKLLSVFGFGYFLFFYAMLPKVFGKHHSRLIKTSLIVKTSAELLLVISHLQLLNRLKISALYPLQIILFPAQFIYYAVRGSLGRYRWK